MDIPGGVQGAQQGIAYGLKDGPGNDQVDDGHSEVAGQPAARYEADGECDPERENSDGGVKIVQAVDELEPLRQLKVGNCRGCPRQ